MGLGQYVLAVGYIVVSVHLSMYQIEYCLTAFTLSCYK